MGKSRRKTAVSLAQASGLLTRFSQKLFSSAVEQAAFIQALQQPQPYPPAILWCQPRPGQCPFELVESLPWQPSWVDRLKIGTRPGQYDLHEQGAYYVLDFSSVFAAVPLSYLNLPQAPQLVIDVCAAPGGKSILAWRTLSPNSLIANEVIGKRLGMLRSNLTRCQISPVAVTNLEVADLVADYAAQADVVIVDAPCSGQSLLAKGTQVLGCFHPRTISYNAQRQKKIIALASQLVRPSGYLLYSTCTFSLEENEGILHWFLERFPRFQPITIPALATYQSAWVSWPHRTSQKSELPVNLPQFPCYRLMPMSGLGAGAFTVLLQLAN